MNTKCSFNDPYSCCLFLHVNIHAIVSSIRRPLTTQAKTVAPEDCAIWELHCTGVLR